MYFEEIVLPFDTRALGEHGCLPEAAHEINSVLDFRKCLQVVTPMLAQSATRLRHGARKITVISIYIIFFSICDGTSQCRNATDLQL